jgi:phosphatidylinositol alpha-1,6-mannosyltransferase
LEPLLGDESGGNGKILLMPVNKIMDQIKNKKVLFYYLSAFSHTGGIEKFNRCFIKALADLSTGESLVPSVVSVYDSQTDERYNNKISFRGFGKKKGRSLRFIIQEAFKNNVLIIGHINLAIAGVIIKILRPKCQLVVIAHGIEVWDKLFFVKKWCLRKADIILAVSNYTKNQLVLRNKIPPSRIKLFPNTIDPFFHIPQQFGKPAYLLERYGLKEDQKLILTLSRLSSSEQYKGYDKVIAALPAILKEIENAVYILAGRYDETEKKRITELLKLYKVSEKVILTGYIDDVEITDHYRLADVFIMPSRKEGFGIVFLEALACGTSVIGGNQDGTVDALHNGSLGTLINPKNTNDIAEAIIENLKKKGEEPVSLQKNVLEQYRFLRYKQRLGDYLEVPNVVN